MEQEKLLFIKNLLKIVKTTIWTDQIKGLPWVSSVLGLFPVKQVNHLKDYAISYSKSRNTASFNKEIELKVAFSQNEVKRMRDWGQKYDSTITGPIRRGMTDLFLSFFNNDWRAIDISKEEYRKMEIIPEIEISHFYSEEGVHSTQTIRFSRKYEGRSYFLDINFNSRKNEASLFISNVQYFGDETHQSGEYSANDVFNSLIERVGGYTSDAKTKRSEIDKSFAKLFDSDTSHLYKWMKVIGDCIDHSGCRGLLQSNEEITKRLHKHKVMNSQEIHPFTNIYYKHFLTS